MEDCKGIVNPNQEDEDENDDKDDVEELTKKKEEKSYTTVLNQVPKKDYEKVGTEKADKLIGEDKKQKYAFGTKLKHEAVVHYELVMKDEVTAYEKKTNNGLFQITLPPFYGTGILFLSAADTTQWKSRKAFQWIMPLRNWEDMPDNPKERLKLMRKDEESRRGIMHTRISRFHPHFVNRYDYFQEHLAEPEELYGLAAGMVDDSTKRLREVPVRARRRSRLHRFDQSQPAFIIDSYEARNLLQDTGIHEEKGGFTSDLVRALLGDYGLDYPFAGNVNSDSPNFDNGLKPSRIYQVYGLGPTRRALPQYAGIPQDSIYNQKYLRTLGLNFRFSPGEAQEYASYNIENYVIYTDYCPRLEGSRRYAGSNLPETRVALFPYADGSRRPLYENSRLTVEGFSHPAEFYSPDYSKQTPPEPTDYRRTLYWNPNLKLDENGKAHVTLYNNSRTTKVTVEAEGQTSNGTLLWNGEE